MNYLYRVVVLREHKENIERGVWADKIEIGDKVISFYANLDDRLDLVAVYPTQYTIITNIESKEEYEKRKASL